MFLYDWLFVIIHRKVLTMQFHNRYPTFTSKTTLDLFFFVYQTSMTWTIFHSNSDGVAQKCNAFKHAWCKGLKNVVICHADSSNKSNKATTITPRSIRPSLIAWGMSAEHMRQVRSGMDEETGHQGK